MIAVNNLHWAGCYIGAPWVANARGPDAFDCYGLVWHDFHLRGIDLPLFAGVDPKDSRLVDSCVMQCEASGDWREIIGPEERCVVAMSRDGTRWDHLGLYTAEKGGSVVHAYDGAAVHITPLRHLSRIKLNHVRFFAWDL